MIEREKKMTKEETTMTGFEIVSYSGDARSKLLTALAKAKEKKFDECDQLIEAAAECLKEAHDSQMDVMQAEATGDDVELGFIMVHAQDHLMGSALALDLIREMIVLYQK